MTLDEVVSRRLGLARNLRGWTQQEAIARLEPHIGSRWSTTNYSNAERAFRGGHKTRHFTADDLWALSRAFGLPITYFLIPPPGVAAISHAKSEETSTGPEVLEMLFASDEPTRHAAQGTLQALDLRGVLRAVQSWAADAKAAVDEVEAGSYAALEAAEDLSDPKRARRALRALGEPEEAEKIRNRELEHEDAE